MPRTVLTPERKAEHVDAFLAARAAGVKADTLKELKGLLSYRDYVQVELSTADTIDHGIATPSITLDLAGDTFVANGEENTDNWEVDGGDSGLSLGSVTRVGDTQVTMAFTGTSVGDGQLTIKALAAALVGYVNSKTLVFTIESES